MSLMRADTVLVGRMWADAESTPDELDTPGTLWTVSLVSDRGQEVPAAWAAARRINDAGTPTLKCFGNYEHPQWRGHGLYGDAYTHRHATVVEPSRLPAVTYLFAQPIPLHLADGWHHTGQEEPGELGGHWWWELRRAGHAG